MRRIPLLLLLVTTSALAEPPCPRRPRGLDLAGCRTDPPRRSTRRTTRTGRATEASTSPRRWARGSWHRLPASSRSPGRSAGSCSSRSTHGASAPVDGVMAHRRARAQGRLRRRGADRGPLRVGACGRSPAAPALQRAARRRLRRSARLPGADGRKRVDPPRAGRRSVGSGTDGVWRGGRAADV